MQIKSWLSHHGIWAIISCSTNMLSVRVIFGDVFTFILVFCILGAVLINTRLVCYLPSLVIHQISLLARDWSEHVTWPNIPQLELGNIREYSPIFKTARLAKKIWRIINTVASIWRENIPGYLSLDIICSSKAQFSSSYALGKLFASRNR